MYPEKNIMHDPYYQFRNEIEEKLKNMESQMRDYDLLRQNPQYTERVEFIKKEVERMSLEVKNNISNLEKVNEKISEDPLRFNLTQDDFEGRKSFVLASKRRILNIEQVFMKTANNSGQDDYSRYRESENQRYIDEELLVQREMLNKQDKQIDQIGRDTLTLNQISSDINQSLKDSLTLIDDVGEHMDRSRNRVDRAIKKMEILLSKKTTWLWIVSVVLTLLLVALITYYFLEN